jgi:hypothetical protein
MRVYLYILAGISSALIGWNLGQFILSDLGWLKSVPELVLFPCIAISLAIGMVSNEIFLSHPTRLKQSFRKVRLPLLMATGLGLAAGLVAAGLALITLLPGFPNVPGLLRTLSWLLIGAAVGLAEGLTWRWHSAEAGDSRRFYQRLGISIGGGTIAALLAALGFEWLRQQVSTFPPVLASLEDPLGFAGLGALLGLTFSLSNSPSYMAALRAGGGFEYENPTLAKIRADTATGVKLSKPTLNSEFLKFVGDAYYDINIEEGRSIQLPGRGKIIIGSAADADLCLPGIAEYAAELHIQPRETILVPQKDAENNIALGRQSLDSLRPRILRHNDLLTFHITQDTNLYGKSFYRFVYYNRFLDPQA